MDLQTAEKSFQDALHHLEGEFAKMQVGRASTGMVELLPVDAYDMTQPMRNLATITTPDAKSIVIQPWDKGVLSAIEKSIRERSDLGLNPINDGNVIRINLPQPTEERRKELAKVAHAKGEETKIAVRNARQKANTAIQDREKSKQMSEDQARAEQKKLQDSVDRTNKSIDELVKKKEKEIMTI